MSAGPSTLAAKWVNYVHLRNIATGRAIYVLNSHAVPSVQGAGGPNYGNLERLRLYRQHMRGLKSLVTTLGATGEPVFVTGDYNVNYRSDSRLQSRMFPYASMHEVGASSNWELLGEPTRGTHVLPGGNATRLIDYVFSVRNRRATPMAQRILSGYSSDHRPVLVEFMLR
jgi:endonuclease/exonuclease/phosphatase (EEP) superfamily protein YafD